MPLRFRKGETEAERETETSPGSLSELAAELEPEPMDTMCARLCLSTSRYICVKDFDILLNLYFKEETAAFLHGGSFHPGTL